jgi:hypothetical protein
MVGWRSGATLARTAPAPLPFRHAQAVAVRFQGARAPEGGPILLGDEIILAQARSHPETDDLLKNWR